VPLYRRRSKARKFGILLSQSQQIFKRQWEDSLPEDCLAKLPYEIILEDDGLQPLTLKLALVDQVLVLPTPVEEEEEGPVSPKLTMTDRLLLLLDRQVEEEGIVRRLKKKMKDIVIPVLSGK